MEADGRVCERLAARGSTLAAWLARHADVVLLWLVAWASGMLMGFGAQVYWDSAGYVQQAITGQVGGLALGRPVFVWVSHGLVVASHALGVSLWHAERLLQVFWMCVSACSAPLTLLLARECGANQRAALLAGLAVAASPALAHVAGAVLTDGPALAATCWGLLLALRALNPARAVVRPGLRGLAAGLVLGLAVGMREQSLAQGLVCALALLGAPAGRRVRFAFGCLAGLVLAAGLPVLWAVVSQPEYVDTVRDWIQAMQSERDQRPYTIWDFRVFLIWLVTLGPLTTLAGLTAWWGQRARLWRIRSLAFALCVPALLQLGMLAFYQDISYSPRYLLPALPGALAIPAGLALDDWLRGRHLYRLGLVVVLAPVLLAAPLVADEQRDLEQSLRGLPSLLQKVPRRTVLITGQPCESVRLWSVIAAREPASWHGRRPAWHILCPGWAWPADLDAHLNGKLEAGYALILDARQGSWQDGDQRETMYEVEAWAGEHPQARVRIWR